MGVDLGTTNCCVAILEPKGPRVLVHGYGERTFPSTISIKNGRWDVGKHTLTDYPADVQFIHDVKRILGRGADDGKLKEDIKCWGLPFEFDDDGNLFCNVGDERVRPIEFCALLLLRAAKIFREGTGKSATSCVITVPAYFSNAQRGATQDAARIANLQVLQLINEPSAVMLAHLSYSDWGGTVLVVDGGGGTTDVTRAFVTTSHEKKTFLVQATAGDKALGGNDSLRVLTTLFRKKVGPSVSDKELQALCEAAKRRGEDPIEITAKGQTYRVAQKKYRGALSKCIGRLKSLIAEALGGESVDAVILAGGASYEGWFDLAVRDVVGGVTQLPRRPAGEVVAEGAAAALLDSVILTDVLNISLGIETQTLDQKKNDIMKVLIPQNHALPTDRTFKLLAANDGETEFILFEGNDPVASKNNKLGSFAINAPVRAEITAKIEVSSDAETTLTATTAHGENSLDVKKKETDIAESELDVMREKAKRRLASGEVGNGSIAVTQGKAPMKKRKRR